MKLCHFIQGDDCTIFFFNIGKKYEAIGFVELETEIVDMQWSTIAMVGDFLGDLFHLDLKPGKKLLSGPSRHLPAQS